MPRRPLLLLALALSVAATAPSLAARRDAAMTALAALPELRRGTVTQISDGATLVLEDGTGVRLAGIEPVLAAPGGNPHWEDAARETLATLVAGRGVSLRG